MQQGPRGAPRRGNYTSLGALVMPVLLGFGALAIDMAWMKMAYQQAQDVSDAASQAALLELRSTGDLALARDAAEQVVARNKVAAGTPELVDLQFGIWDESARSFTPSTRSPNAVRARVGRRDAQGVPYLLARIWGYDRADVIGTSTSAARALHVILAIDITNSWDLRNFDYARSASQLFLQTLVDSHGPDDRFGMVNFTGAYGVEYTPMRLVDTEAADGVAATQWTTLNTASKSGQPFAGNLSQRCRQHPGVNVWTAGLHASDTASHGAGGCFPGMWREYSDEPGTDHTVALDMARTMFTEQPEVGAYRALVMLTDGIPNGIAPNHGALRAAEGYVDPKRAVVGPRPHTTTQIQDDSVTKAHQLYDDLAVNTWVVSFVQSAPFLDDMTTDGDGYFVRASTAAEIVPIFEDIANSLPIAIVE